jgi:hypothetical protein
MVHTKKIVVKYCLTHSSSFHFSTELVNDVGNFIQLSSSIDQQIPYYNSLLSFHFGLTNRLRSCNLIKIEEKLRHLTVYILFFAKIQQFFT